MRGGGGVAGAAGEGEVDPGVGEADRLVHAGQAGGVPGDGDVHVLEGAGADHEALGGAAFLRRAAVVADPALDALSRPASPSRRRRRAWRRRPAGCGRSHGRRRHRPSTGLCSAMPACWLSPGRASYSPRMAITGPSSPASAITAVGMPATSRDDAEALRLQHRQVFGDAAVLAIGKLRRAPHAVGQGDVLLALAVDDLPDLLAVLHDVPRLPHVELAPGAAVG